MNGLKRSLYFGFVFVVITCHSKAYGNNIYKNGKLLVNSVSFSKDGILKLEVAIHLDETKTLYSWKGHLYPLYEHGLFIKTKSKSNEKIHLEITNKIMPVVPHPLDIVTTKRFKYPKLLSFKVIGGNKKVFLGCIDFKLIYDTSKIVSNESKLSAIYIESDMITICNDHGK